MAGNQDGPDDAERRSRDALDRFGVTQEAVSAAFRRGGDPSAEADLWARAWNGTDLDWVNDLRRMRRAEACLLRVKMELLQWEAAGDDETIGLRRAAEVIRGAMRPPYL